MNNYQKHALTEFRAADWMDENGRYKDEMQEMICNHVLALLDVFADEGHSGTTAPYAIELFSKLAKFDPIVPLTGEDWEWNEVSDGDKGMMYQNKRCGAVFKQTDRFDGQPYYLDGKVFWEWYKSEDGEMSKSYFTGGDSQLPIVFPYTPKSEYVFRATEQFPNEELPNE
jgi:hypothetical protein